VPRSCCSEVSNWGGKEKSFRGGRKKKSHLTIFGGANNKRGKEKIGYKENGRGDWLEGGEKSEIEQNKRQHILGEARRQKMRPEKRGGDGNGQEGSTHNALGESGGEKQEKQ